MMNYGKMLAEVMIVLDVLASIGYTCQGDYRHAIYWLAAGVLTATVTF